MSDSADSVLEQMMRTEPPSDAGLLRFRVLSRERNADKLRVLGRAIFAPNQADYRNGRLGQSLEVIYYFARPWRLLRKRLISPN